MLRDKTYVASDLNNHDRPKMFAASKDELLRIVKALSEATHGRWAAYRVLPGVDGVTEWYGIWADGNRIDN